MSSAYTYNPAIRPTGATLPSDGDAPIKAADVNPALQAAGDLAANAIIRLEPLANIAALAAILAPTNNLQRYVLGFGLYVFRTASPLIMNVSPFAVAPADATPGYWISSDALLRLGVSSGPSYRWVPGRNPFGITNEIAFSDTQDDLAGSLATDIKRYVTGTAFANRNTASTNARQMYFDLTPHLIHGARLNVVYATIVAVSHATLPSRLPRLAVLRHPVDAYSPTMANLYSGTYFQDAPASTAAFAAPHEFGGALDQNNEIDLNEFTYWAFVANEASTNAEAGLIVGGFELQQS